MKFEAVSRHMVWILWGGLVRLSVKEIREVADLYKACRFALVWSCCVFVGGGIGYAQILQPGKDVEPGRIERGLEPIDKPEVPPESEEAPRVPSPSVPVGSDTMGFIFRGLQIDGVTVFDLDELQALWRIPSGGAATVGDIYRLASDITRLYSEQGYILSFALVPEQDITSKGTVRIQVVEGTIDNVVFAGEASDETNLIRHLRALAKPLAGGGPLRNADLERTLLLMQDVSGVKVEAQIRKSQTRSGASDMVVTVQRKSLSSSVSYNNFLSESYGRSLVSARANARGFLWGTEELVLGYSQSAEPGAYKMGSAHFSMPVGNQGLKLELFGQASKSVPIDESLQLLEYEGVYQTASLSLSYPLIRSRGKNLILSADLSGANSESRVFGDSLLTQDHLRSVRMSAAFDWAPKSGEGYALTPFVQKGLDIAGAKGNSRANGRVDPLIVGAAGQQFKSLFPLAGGNVWQRIRFKGQKTFGDGGLFSGDECSFGGRQYGRGFEGGVIAGDHCLLGAFEVGWDYSAKDFEYRLSSFTDVGLVGQKGELQPGEDRYQHATSSGVALSVNTPWGISGQIEIARQMSTPEGTDRDRNFMLSGMLHLNL